MRRCPLLARRFRAQGHIVKLRAPQVVTPAVKSHTHDMADAEALGEAVTRPPRRVMPITEMAPQDLPSLQRVRERLIKVRTALINAIRGVLSE